MPLPNPATTREMQIHIGCSGWFYWHWRGIFYPEVERTDHWFRHYTQTFATVELNAPFYKWPKPATVKAWRRNAPPGFRYSVKVNNLITHEKRMRGTRKLVREFYGIADTLGAQMGCFLFQFPPSYKYTPSRLQRLLRQLDPAHRNALEFRHKSWWREAVYRQFCKAGLTFCSISSPRLPDELILTSPALYIRLHGRSRWYRHDYSPDELADWTRRIKASGADEAWIYFNNDREGFAIKNAQELMRQLAGGDVRV
ncbi:MAG: DUF72 domain-containing protein [Verrucomicrobiota bacterium]|nr:DUF72 domain-containing protein [Verrucomicrobiota bacterium]